MMVRSVTDTSKIASNRVPIPRSVTEALSGPYAEEWSQANQSELASHAENETWTLVDKPQNCNVIGSMWVFKVIYDQSTGSVDRFKARLVARGDSQQREINYDETYAPVARFASFRILIALAAHLDLDLEHIDITTAYLYGKIDKDIDMRQPPGQKVRGSEHSLQTQ